MALRMVTLSARYGEPRITYSDVDADDDATAVETALDQVGGKDWCVVFVHEIKKPEGLCGELAVRMSRKAEQRRDLFGGVM